MKLAAKLLASIAIGFLTATPTFAQTFWIQLGGNAPGTVGSGGAPTGPSPGAGGVGGGTIPANPYISGARPPIVESGIPAMPDPSGRSTPLPAAPALQAHGTATIEPPQTLAPQALEILPDGHAWNSLSPDLRQSLSETIAREPELRHLLGRIRSHQDSISMDDVQFATRLWLNGKNSGDAALYHALEATLVTSSGVVRVLPGSAWQQYRDLYSRPDTTLGQNVRTLANEFLTLESIIAPYLVTAGPTTRTQMLALFLELHALNRFLDRAIVSDPHQTDRLVSALQTMSLQLQGMARGLANTLPSAVLTTFLATALPTPALVAFAIYGVYQITNEMVTGRMAERIAGFTDRLTSADPAISAQAVAEAGVTLGSMLYSGPLSVQSVSTRWLAIREAGFGMAALRLAWQSRFAGARDVISSTVQAWSINGGMSRVVTKVQTWINQAPTFGGEIVRLMMESSRSPAPAGILNLFARPDLGQGNQPDFGIELAPQSRVIQVFYGTPIPEISPEQQRRFLGSVAVQVELAPGSQLFQLGAPESSWFVTPSNAAGQNGRALTTVAPLRVWQGVASPLSAGGMPGGAQQIFIPRTTLEQLRPPR